MCFLQVHHLLDEHGNMHAMYTTLSYALLYEIYSFMTLYIFHLEASSYLYLYRDRLYLSLVRMYQYHDDPSSTTALRSTVIREVNVNRR